MNVKHEEVSIKAEPVIKAVRDRASGVETTLIDEINYRLLQAVMFAALASLVVGVLTSG